MNSISISNLYPSFVSKDCIVNAFILMAIHDLCELPGICPTENEVRNVCDFIPNDDPFLFEETFNQLLYGSPERRVGPLIYEHPQGGYEVYYNRLFKHTSESLYKKAKD